MPHLLYFADDNDDDFFNRLTVCGKPVLSGNGYPI